MRAAYLGPPGTNSHDALVGTGLDVEQVALPTVPAVIRAVQDGEVERGLVPLENSREGAVGSTLDSLVFDAPDVRIVGEVVHTVTYCLAAAEWIEPDEVCTVHSHPQALGQCAGFLRSQLPGAAIVAERSTADAVRAVTEGGALAGNAPHAAIGTRHAARLYGAAVLAEDDRGRRGQRDAVRVDRARRGRRGRAGRRARTRRSSSSGAAATSPRAGSSTAWASSPRAASTSRGSSRGRGGSGSATTCSSAISRAAWRSRTWRTRSPDWADIARRSGCSGRSRAGSDATA